MKKLVLLISIVLGMTAQGQNTLSLTGGSGHPGDTVTVTLSMANSDAVTAMQTFIPLGTQLTYVPGSAALTSRSNGHSLTATVLEGSLRIYSYSLSLASFTGNSGALLTFKVVLGQEPGYYTLTPTQSVLSSATGAGLAVSNSSTTVTILAPKVQVSPSSLDYGHVPIRSSYTRTVTVRNIGNEPLALSGVVLNDASLSATPSTATLSAGAQQSVTLTYSPTVAGATIYSAVFQTNARVGDSVVTIAADPYSVNELRPLDVTGYTDSIVTIELRMNNMDSIVGLQTSIVLPSALTYVDGSFEADAYRATRHTATVGLQGDTLTLLLTSMDNTPIHGADGVVARFQVRLHGYGGHTLYLLNTALSDDNGNNVLSAVYSGYVNIYSPYLSCNSSMDLGNTPVTEPAEATLSLNNYGNAPLVIDRVVFLQDGWRVMDALPLTVNNYGYGSLRVQYNGTTEGTHQATMLLYTNDPRNDMKRITLTAHRYEPNSLYLEGTETAPAETPEVSLMLDNYSDVTALQVDVQYPHRQFTLNPGNVSLTSRAAGHLLNAVRLDDSTLRVLILSMQNTPFAGNSGAVARLQLHAHDTLDANSYPIRMSNITTVCTDGVDRLSSVQTTGWFATRVVHDTTVLEIHDTTFVDVPVHDTTYVHDTTFVDVPVHDTTYITQIDTLTEYVPVHDTTYITQVDTLTEYVPVHDTTYITQIDTLTEYVYVHDTTYITQTDTVTLTEYVPVHDTTYITQTDTVTLTQYDTITNTVFDTIDNYIHDTVTIADTLWLTQTDTLWLHDTIIIHDTVYITEEGIDGVDALNAKVYSSRGQIVVEGTDGKEVTLFDISGRMLATKQDYGTAIRFDAPASGTYMIKIGNHAAKRVVVVR